MPRKPSSNPARTPLKQQPRKALERQSTRLGELDTTPTSHHEESPLPTNGRKVGYNDSKFPDPSQSADPNEFEDGLDDNDLTDFANTQQILAAPLDGKIAWSERDSETHRSSSMSSQEEEQSGKVFGYIGEGAPFTSPTPGHSALPDTLPLPVTGDLDFPDCQNQQSLRFDLSETASTAARSSPFGRSHASRRSATTSQAASVRDGVEHAGVDTHLPEAQIGKIPHSPTNKISEFTTDTSTQGMSSLNVTGGLLPSGCGSAAPKDGVLDNIITLPCHSGEGGNSRRTIATLDGKLKKKRKQRAKSPLEFDEDTHEVKFVARQRLEAKPAQAPSTEHKKGAKTAHKSNSKKRKENSRVDERARKTAKSALASEPTAQVTDTDSRTHCTTQVDVPVTSVDGPPFNSWLRDDDSTKQLRASHPSSDTGFAETFEESHGSPMPESGYTHQSSDTSEHSEKLGDCIFVASMKVGHDTISSDNFSAPLSREQSFPSGNLDDIKAMGLVPDLVGRLKSDTGANDVGYNFSKMICAETSQLQRSSNLVGSDATNRRAGRNFNVSEGGSPIPRKEHDIVADIASTEKSQKSVSGTNRPNAMSMPSPVLKYSGISKNHRRHEECLSTTKDMVSVQRGVSMLQNGKAESRHNISSSHTQNPVQPPIIKSIEPAAPLLLSADRSRQHLHDLVEIFMKRFDTRGAEVLKVTSAYRIAGTRCVDKIQSRFQRERSAFFDAATGHAGKFHSLVSKTLKHVDKNRRKGSESFQNLLQNVSSRTMMYERATAALEALQVEVKTKSLGKVQGSSEAPCP